MHRGDLFHTLRKLTLKLHISEIGTASPLGSRHVVTNRTKPKSSEAPISRMSKLYPTGRHHEHPILSI